MAVGFKNLFLFPTLVFVNNFDGWSVQYSHTAIFLNCSVGFDTSVLLLRLEITNKSRLLYLSCLLPCVGRPFFHLSRARQFSKLKTKYICNFNHSIVNYPKKNPADNTTPTCKENVVFNDWINSSCCMVMEPALSHARYREFFHPKNKWGSLTLFDFIISKMKSIKIKKKLTEKRGKFERRHLPLSSVISRMV